MSKKHLCTLMKWVNIVTGAIATGILFYLGLVFLRAEGALSLKAFLLLYQGEIQLLITFFLLTISGSFLFWLIRRLPE